jgi:outer membrane immunogenic protein
MGLTMKKVLIAAAAVLTATASQAADLGARPYTKAPPMIAPVSSWTGLYIGGNVGYGWGAGKTDFSFLPDETAFDTKNATLDSKPEGVIGGAQIGYNWQMGAIVTGLEADIQGSGIKGSAKSPLASIGGAPAIGSFRSSDDRLSWFGTVRGRLGATLTPSFLLYATGGLAYGEVKDSANTFFTTAEQMPVSVNQTKVGWTAGAGAEWMFAHNWSAKLEYLFVDLGKTSVTVADPVTPALSVRYDWKNQDHIVRAGVNYHF